MSILGFYQIHFPQKMPLILQCDLYVFFPSLLCIFGRCDLYSGATYTPNNTEDNMDAALGGNLQRTRGDGAVPVSSSWHEHSREWLRSDDSAVTPNSSPSPSRRFRPAGRACVRWPSLTPLKRKGGAESDGPPKKLFVTGVLDPAAHTASASLADSAPSPQSSPLASHLHPAH
ncbi:uncharacterized protein LOC133650190 isoform X4 [Entelurus aequoreus]|uniref:uncharacterized protein LOC133650190 isoform X4 n=1 Tax=Entelurus aequoreus TaxID=161455 RepID=UPI002B1E012D|nr:uncharacterized protein LOC133650190 isoform X4 [Entelurus aequoreus]